MRSNLLKHNNLMLRSERRERLEAWAASDSPISHSRYYSMIRKSMPSDLIRGWVPVFPRDKREAFARRSCSNKKIERDDDSKKNHPALAARGEQNTSLRRTWNKPDRRRGIARRPVLCRCWPGRHVASCGVGCPGRHGIRTFCDHAVAAGVGLCELSFP